MPLAVNFSSEGTSDFDTYDEGKLSHSWAITNGVDFNQTLTEASPNFTFSEAGSYQVTLTVTDTEGESNSSSFEVIAGNEPPVVAIDFGGSNKSFWFGEKSMPEP